VLEDPEGSQSRPDQPLAPFSVRRFGMRRVRSLTLAVSAATATRPSLIEQSATTPTEESP